MFDAPITWLGLLATASFLAVLPRRMIRAREIILAASSLGLMLAARVLTPGMAAMLVGACGFVLLGLRATRALAARRPMVAALLVASPVFAALVIGKALTASGHADRAALLQFVGFSYFAVKVWTLVKDVCDGRVTDLRPGGVAAYLLFLPTYPSGPMHLYPEFRQAVERPTPLDGLGLLDALFRISLGMVKVKLLAPLLAPWSLLGLPAEGPLPVGGTIAGAFVFSVVLWADFSGYSDMAIGVARLLGIPVPENFRWPYLAGNVRDFWQRWHITFSRVLTSYVFVPVSRALQPVLGGNRRAMALASTLVTFAVCGYWHGATLNFTLWGLYHGLGMFASDLLRPARRRPAGPPGFAARLRAALAIALTFTFVSLGWILFVLPAGRIWP